MPTASHLLHVNSRPTLVSDEIWSEWYTTEHLPDLVNSKTSKRASFYVEESPPNSPPDPNANPRHFLAIYQTELGDCLKSDNYLHGGVRQDSTLFEQASGKAPIHENGEFDARYYDLIQDFDPKELGDATSPFIITVEMNAHDEEDFHKWYRDEHLDLLSKIPGYRKSTRYALGPATALTLGRPGKFLAIHEFDGFDGLGGPEAEAANTTEWTIRMIKESDPMIVRLWKLIHNEGDWK